MSLDKDKSRKLWSDPQWWVAWFTGASLIAGIVTSVVQSVR